MNGFRPGDVFREYAYRERSFFGVLHDGVSCPPAVEARRAHGNPPRTILIDDLDGAVRAEVAVEYWGGHIGTSDHGFSVNGGDWVAIPQPAGTPTDPACYYRTVFGNPSVEIPLASLKRGRNAFQFKAGPQVKYDWGWGFYWVYGFVVRVFYEPAKSHCEGKLTVPAPGSAFGEMPMVGGEFGDNDDAYESVDFVGRYRDFDWAGNGLFRQWHYQLRNADIHAHIGTARCPPFGLIWDTRWIPDQEEPIEIIARVRDRAHGTLFVTEPASCRFVRQGRSVSMYASADVPERFGVRTGDRMRCTIETPKEAERACRAFLQLSTWSAAYATEIAFNGQKIAAGIGKVHDYSFDRIDVPVELLRNGANEFSIYSSLEHHAAEVNWPGPVLFVERSTT